jgi:hypothetical protein
MRTGKIGLNGFLTTINQAETDRCPCRQAPAETPHRVLLGSLGSELYDDLRGGGQLHETWQSRRGVTREEECPARCLVHAKNGQVGVENYRNLYNLL